MKSNCKTAVGAATAAAIVLWLLCLIAFLGIRLEDTRETLAVAEQELTAVRTENLEITRENWKLQKRCPDMDSWRRDEAKDSRATGG